MCIYMCFIHSRDASPFASVWGGLGAAPVGDQRVPGLLPPLLLRVQKATLSTKYKSEEQYREVLLECENGKWKYDIYRERE